MSTLSENIGGRKRLVGGPFGSKLVQSDYQETGVPVIRGGNMEFLNRWIGGEFAYVSEEKVDRDLSANLAQPGDIIVTQRGTLGQVSIVPPYLPHRKYVISQSQMAISVDTQRADPSFVYYFLRSPDFLQYVENSAIKTGVPHINLGLLRDTPVQWPDLEAQQQVAAVLSALDDKIELNQRMNETLEALAQAIFKDWFVAFGPTRRKMEGATDPVAILGGLIPEPAKAAPLAALFPARFCEDGLPEGWERLPLEKTIVLQRGFDLPKTDRTDGLFPVIAASGLNGTHNEFKVKGPGVCTGRSGVLGGVFFVKRDFWPLNTSLWVKEYPNATPLYAFYLLKTLDLLSLNAGSAVPTLNRNHVHKLQVPTPRIAVVLEFEKLASTLYDRIDTSEVENHTLAETRDYILPKLMSGVVRVREAEKAVP
ncbi:restriction endonuclease subunit S [Devosia sp. XK-2]|uniref:restriction endonuclease subunit S n=1 Tax=Devosia sp. XK-2 TaxID=3126689 RepID=UPI0030CD9771